MISNLISLDIYVWVLWVSTRSFDVYLGELLGGSSWIFDWVIYIETDVYKAEMRSHNAIKTWKEDCSFQKKLSAVD